VASDVFSPFDPGFDHSLHRFQDIGQAKFLLKQAGHESLAVTLTTSVITTGTVAMATVLAEQAKAAGVTIRLQNVPPGTFFGPGYLQWDFSQDYYPYSPYLAQVAYSMLPGSPFNETHTGSPAYTSLYQQANATASPALRTEILHQMQKFDFTQGGYLIPAYVDSLDAYSDTVGGYTAARVDEPLSNFDYAHFYFK
jgi:peptide/nickel transport system substrate-binding protein